jgi:hypothetical protein
VWSWPHRGGPTAVVAWKNRNDGRPSKSISGFGWRAAATCAEMLLTFRQRGWELGTVGRWLAAIGLGIAALAACIAVADVSLP